MLLFAKTLRTVMTFSCDNVMVFESLQPVPFCLEKSSLSSGYFNVLTEFSVVIWLFGILCICDSRVQINDVCLHLKYQFLQ